jgi:hypothetical protein
MSGSKGNVPKTETETQNRDVESSNTFGHSCSLGLIKDDKEYEVSMLDRAVCQVETPASRPKRAVMICILKSQLLC